MTSNRPPTPGSRRTTTITAVSIVAVGLAGLFAIGANLGILTSTEHRNVGTASVVGESAPAGTRVIDVYVGSRSTTTSATDAGDAPAAEPTRAQPRKDDDEDERTDDERYEGGDSDD